MSAQFLRGTSNAVYESSSPGHAAPKSTRGITRRPPSSRVSGTHATCSGRGDCITCLYRENSLQSEVQAVPLAIGDCVWCANQRRCIPNMPEAVAKCDDVEDSVCPAVLHSRIPQNHRVIHVGIRKGGPEALVQMHLALHHWGFNTSLDTRKSMKEKGGPVMPYFLEVYEEEFRTAPPLRWVKNYDDWHQSAQEGDIMIATETWACKNDAARYLPNGIRQMQWHLTVWPRRDRSQCTIAGHTNYVTRDYMRQSVRALMYPYISPNIVALASTKSWKSMKQDLVLYDSDTHLKDSDLVSQHGVARTAKIASGYTPHQLYELYGKSKVGIDLQLPGGERFIYEAALFDVCVIVDDALNGGDHEDFPIPDKFRVPSKNLGALNEAVDACVRDYDQVVAEFAPLKQLVLKQHVTFLRQVRRYFSNSVHISTVVCNQDEMDAFGARFLLAAVLQAPFVVVEFFVPKGVAMNKDVYQVLLDNSHLAAVHFTTLHSTEFDAVCAVVSAASLSPSSEQRMLQAATHLTPKTNFRRSLMTVWMSVDAILLSEDVFHSIASQLVLEQRAAALERDTYVKGVPSVVYRTRIIASDDEATKVVRYHTPLIAVLSQHKHPKVVRYHTPLIAVLSQHKHALHRITCDTAAQPPSSLEQVGVTCRHQRNKVDVTQGRLTVEYSADQLERVAQHVALVNAHGNVVWGSQQAFVEVVAPFLCTHELWRQLVGTRVPVAEDAALRCK
ncbi:Hypothetical protein, putative [Bodo saltans]|uniref:Uncharacterized protein n=1 Tax=Bodo saltans TaxID=75058 RepID=A0A0S4J9B2_BODSA|nr:Hypothetical protein, putative [Bodo saltans]|eukprot:CUG86713.1 Hypothetical protein, putative [Bodo saltans]